MDKNWQPSPITLFAFALLPRLALDIPPNWAVVTAEILTALVAKPRVGGMFIWSRFHDQRSRSFAIEALALWFRVSCCVF
jgi:hypothetical protein